MADEQEQILVVLLETHRNLWLGLNSDSSNNEIQSNLDQKLFLEQIEVFLNTIKLQNEACQIGIIAVHEGYAPFLYKEINTIQSEQEETTQTVTQQQSIGEILLQKIKHLTANINNHYKNNKNNNNNNNIKQFGAQHEPALSAAFARALCLINKKRKIGVLDDGEIVKSRVKARILCIMYSSDSSGQYIPVMNSIFSAQRMEVMIDTVMVGRNDSAFLQQAAHITGGFYCKIKYRDGMLQYLLSLYSANLNVRQFVLLPKTKGWDFRASCFCHQRAIDQGYVCSVCLSIFCEKKDVCLTCGTQFVAKDSHSNGQANGTT